MLVCPMVLHMIHCPIPHLTFSSFASVHVDSFRFVSMTRKCRIKPSSHTRHQVYHQTTPFIKRLPVRTTFALIRPPSRPNSAPTSTSPEGCLNLTMSAKALCGRVGALLVGPEAAVEVFEVVGELGGLGEDGGVNSGSGVGVRVSGVPGVSGSGVAGA